jgi:hypothetical protein
MFYKQLNSKQLLEKIKDLTGIYSVTVAHNPDGEGEGGKKTLISHTHKKGYLSTFNSGQHNINGVDYAFTATWTDGTYTGTFDLDTTPFQHIKPEVYKAGDTVQILENARDCGDYCDWDDDKKSMVGKVFKIFSVYDTNEAVWYSIQPTKSAWYVNFPLYCIQKIETIPEPVEELLQVQLTEKQFSKLKEMLK